MFSIRRFRMAQQILIGVFTCSALVALVLLIFLSAYSQRLAVNESENTLKNEAVMVVEIIEYAQADMRTSALLASAYFNHSLPSPRLTGNVVRAGNVSLPEVFFGGIPANGNQSYIQAYQKKVPDVDIAFLIPSGGKLYRGTTLLKNTDGSYRDGSEVTDDYAKTVLAGDTHTGMVVRAGKMYALAVVPIKDQDGKVIVAINARVPADKAMQDLKDRLKSMVIGKTGYPFILSRPVGDMKEPFFVLHPVHEGKPIKEIDAAQQQVMNEFLEKGSGFLAYDWQTGTGASDTRIAAFQELPSLKWVIASSAPLSEFTAPYDTIRRWTTAGIALLVVVLMLGIWLFVRWQLKPLNVTTETVAKMADSLDLTRRLGSTAADEIGEVSRSLDHMVDNFQKAVHNIMSEVARVDETAETVNNATREIAQGSSAQSSASAAISASIEEMTVSINSVATGAANAQEIAQHAREMSEEGNNIIERTQNEMSTIAQIVTEASNVIATLDENSREINNVVGVIKEVADQTNLLALNASIEAARAGEAGRGFAVVADEVRKLAERTAQSTGDINAVISKIQASVGNAIAEMKKAVEQVGSGQSLTQEARERMNTIHEEISHVSSAVVDISEALKEQNQASQNVAQHVESIVQLTESNHATTEETAANAQKLKDLAASVKETLARFKV
ncbi:MAG: methyl-accepting chemotaxis protein [Zoogloeaceae bacterium]|jgi:methyl-accepting chemotaxis protein|nr:methyl-accepting chemotaxis protein [Zoogloeaceae bacterium]